MGRRGGFGGMPNNMNNIMKQAQKMQKQMAQVQEDIDKMTFEASAGGGVVKAVVSGKKELLNIVLKEEVVDPDDIEMLQDLVVAAVNEAMKIADEEINKKMSGITGGLNMPGLF